MIRPVSINILRICCIFRTRK